MASLGTTSCNSPLIPYLTLTKCCALVDIGDHELPHLCSCHLQYTSSSPSISYCFYCSIHVFLCYTLLKVILLHALSHVKSYQSIPYFPRYPLYSPHSWKYSLKADKAYTIFKVSLFGHSQSPVNLNIPEVEIKIFIDPIHRSGCKSRFILCQHPTEGGA